MTLPEAKITHWHYGRMRLKVTSQRGNLAFFEALSKEITSHVATLETNVLTGSVLIISETQDIDVDDLVRIGETKGLFQLRTTDTGPVPLSKNIRNFFGRWSQGIEKWTGGELDLPLLIFLFLLANGIFQICRGNIKAPPWYTAFWYAFGVFSKSFIERSSEQPLKKQ
jgi:hypothetical protein